MKVITSALAIFFLFISVTPGFAQKDRTKIAVLEFRVTENAITQSDADYLTDRVRESTRLALPQSRFLIMTRENFESLLSPEQLVRVRNCNTEICEVEAGRMVGADYIISGHIRTYSNKLRLMLKLHETASGDLTNARTLKAIDLDELESRVELETRGLFAPLVDVEPILEKDIVDIPEKNTESVHEKPTSWNVRLNTMYGSANPYNDPSYWDTENQRLVAFKSRTSFKGELGLLVDRQWLIGLSYRQNKRAGYKLDFSLSFKYFYHDTFFLSTSLGYNSFASTINVGDAPSWGIGSGVQFLFRQQYGLSFQSEFINIRTDNVEFRDYQTFDHHIGLVYIF